MSSLPEQSDHDILITLTESVRQQHQNISEKIDGLKQNIKDIKDVDLKELKNGMHERIVVLEMKVASMEKLRDETNYSEIVKTVRANNDWIASFKVSWKTTLFIVSSATAVVTFILTLIIQLTNFIKIR